MTAERTQLRTDDDLAVYDLDVHASELWVVAGPDGWDDRLAELDTDALPEGFRWVKDDEWAAMVDAREGDPR